MTKGSSSFQRNIIVFICFILLRSCLTRNYFSDLDLNTQTLNPGVTGFMIAGSAANNYLGYSVSTAGDIDNDGSDDIIVGAYGGNQAYVLYGGSRSTRSNIDLSSTTLNPSTTGFMIKGNSAGDKFGNSVSTAGNIDKDAYDDIIVGAPQKNAVYVIYGGARATMSNWDFSTQTLNPTSTGFTITGNAAGDGFGYSVSTAGDIDNDGYDDIIVGAPSKSSSRGAAYVIFGQTRSSFTNLNLNIAPLNPSVTGFTIIGNAAGDKFGYSVSIAGDIDNDGYDDIIVGAFAKSGAKGAAYVIYGKAKSLTLNIDLSSTPLDPLTTGFMITGNAGADNFGYPVSSAGDIDNDGYDDIIVGAENKNAAYVIYGGSRSTRSNIDLSSTPLNPTSTGFMITGDTGGAHFGAALSPAGDFNKDGYDDIIVGATYENSNKGAVYVIYGRAKSAMTNIVLSSTPLDPLTTGFTIAGNAAGDWLGTSVSTAGDIDNDGYDDIIVGAPNKNSNKGAAYVIYASCPKNCKQCSSESVCTQCKNPYLLYHSECLLTSCPDTTFADTAVTCDDCSSNCKHCSSTSVCTECITPFALYQSVCLSSCPMTTFNSNNVCKDCPLGCSSCTSESSCQACYPGYTLSNSLCVLSKAQEEALKAVSSAVQGIGSAICVGSAIVPFSELVSKIVQNTRYLNLSVTSELAEVYQTWQTELISWDVPNVMSDLDHFEMSPPLFARYDIASPFLVNFWPTLLTIGVSFGTFIACILLQKLFEHAKYKGWAYSLTLKLVAGSFNFALVQAYTCLDDILLNLVLDAKTNPFNSFFSWASMVCAVIFLTIGCLQVFFNFWTVMKYQNIKKQGMKEIDAFNEKNKYWELFYSDFSDDNLWSQSFFAIAIIRSALSSLIITVLYDYPLMQTSFLVIIDGAIILFLYFKSPFNTLRGKLAQYYFEIITLLVHLCAFVLALQDSFKYPSGTVRLIMSMGILYLNTALVSGAIGFMFIEIYKTISEKTKAVRLKQRQSLPEDSQEIQNLTETVKTLQLPEPRAPKRQDWTNQDQIASSEKVSFFPGKNRKRTIARYDLGNLESFRALESNFNADHSRELDMSPSKRLNQQRNQEPRPIRIVRRSQAQAELKPIENRLQISKPWDQ